MDDTIMLDPSFSFIGTISFATSVLAFICSTGHAWFYFSQRKVQSDEFMRGLACRMKAIFTVMSVMFLIDILSGYGLIIDYTMRTWLFLCIAKSMVSMAYVAALFWLYTFYRRPHV